MSELKRLRNHLETIQGFAEDPAFQSDVMGWIAQECREALEMTGKVAYDAYRNHTGGKSLVSGKPIPIWEELSPEICAAWCSAATAVLVAERDGVRCIECGLEDGEHYPGCPAWEMSKL